MKRVIILLVSLTFALNGFAQQLQDTANTDTATVDTTTGGITDTANAANQLLQQQTLGPGIKYSPVIPLDVAKNFIANISRMLFWPSYQEDFVIGVTNDMVKYELARFFQNKRIHGRSVVVLLVNENSLPLVNLIYVTHDRSGLIPTLDLTYQGKSVVIISENPNDVTTADIVLLPTYTSDGDKTYSYEYNTFSLQNKGIYIMPELKAYSTVQ